MFTVTQPFQRISGKDSDRHALDDHEGTASIGRRTINNLRFADDIDGLAEEEKEPAKLVEPLDKTSTAYGMEISAEKKKQKKQADEKQYQRHQRGSKLTDA